MNFSVEASSSIHCFNLSTALSLTLMIDLFRNGVESKEETSPGKDSKRKISAYSDVPNDMFYCHLCAKHMWDSTSFENHLKGRTHQVNLTMISLFKDSTCLCCFR